MTCLRQDDSKAKLDAMADAAIRFFDQIVGSLPANEETSYATVGEQGE